MPLDTDDSTMFKRSPLAWIKKHAAEDFSKAIFITHNPLYVIIQGKGVSITLFEGGSGWMLEDTTGG